MKIKYLGLAVAAIVGGSACGLAAADDIPAVTVQGTRAISAMTIDRSASGVPIVAVSLSYGVSTSGLDLASHAGALELEKRVRDAALAACKDISARYPTATPNEAECAKIAADKAMVQVRELEAAAAKK